MKDFSNCSNYYNCENIQDSQYIVNSQNVDSSSFIHNSNDISYCEDVYKSTDVANSHQIFCSQFINDSKRVSNSRNVIESSNIVNSDAVYVSKNIYECHNIMRCGELRKCINATDSLFCAESTDIKHCLFCYGLVNAEYYIFNKPVDKDRYEIILKQYLRYMNEELSYTREAWPKSMLIPSLPNFYVYYDKHYQLNYKFWQWIRTIPGFDNELLYTITLNFDLL